MLYDFESCNLSLQSTEIKITKTSVERCMVDRNNLQHLFWSLHFWFLQCRELPSCKLFPLKHTGNFHMCQKQTLAWFFLIGSVAQGMHYTTSSLGDLLWKNGIKQKLSTCGLGTLWAPWYPSRGSSRSKLFS